MKCARCQQENPPRAKFCLECGADLEARRGLSTEGASADLQRALREALDQQAATAEILRVISRSPSDVQPVFDAIARNAVTLCGGIGAVVLRYDGELLHVAGYHNVSAETVAMVERAYPRRPARDYPPGRALLDRSVVHVPDLRAATEFTASTARQRGAGSFLAVPLLREGEAIGVIGLARDVVGLFPTQQIGLLQIFADQATIAIENVRLFNELQQKNRALTDAHAQVSEAFERQTATSEILRVISQSPTDVQPVFDAIVRSGAALCHAPDVIILMADGDALRIAASVGSVAEAVGHSQLVRGGGLPLTRGSVSGRAFIDRRTVHVRDVSAMPDNEFPEGKTLQREYGGQGTTLAVPLVRGDRSLGVITLLRNEVSPFTDRQVALLQTFADQAVIAIENVRLFNETREALERQTATSEILRVIAGSPTEIQPVLDTIAENAARVCGANDAVIYRIEQGEVTHIVAAYGPIPKRRVGQEGRNLIRESVPGLAMLERRTVHVHDIQSKEGEDFPFSQNILRQLGIQSRTMLSTPLLREGTPLGAILIRRVEVRPFTNKQIELLETFADQAVIAIENARLFTELQERNRALTDAHAQVTEALEQQTATAEILRVIASSPTDLQRVLDTVAESAARLCEATDVLIHRVEGDTLPIAASAGSFAATYPAGEHFPIDRGSVVGRAVLERRTVHVHDLAAESDDEFPVARVFQQRYGHRTVLATPLIRNGVPLGAIWIRRTEIRPFTGKQITLLETFADQAVIAIENVRLFTELEEKNQALTRAHARVVETLERQTATSEILRTIAQVQTDVQPVFEAIADSAMRLLGAWAAAVTRYDGELVSMAAARGGLPGSGDAAKQRLELPHPPASPPEQAVLTRRVHQVVDVETDPSCSSEFRRHAAARGFRSFVAVPMLRGGEPLGMIVVSRAQPGEFSTSEVTLLQTFADQAVIAVENARLLAELHERNHALTEAHSQMADALENQTATSEILRTIAQAHTDVQPVFETIVRHAGRLCHAANAAVFVTDGRLVYHPANYGSPSDALAGARARYPRPLGMDTTAGMAILTRSVIHVADIEDPSAVEILREIGRALGFRSVVTVPMLREDEAIGAILVARGEPGRFGDAEVDLLRTFADQAVIAIENVRLFQELGARNRELTTALQQQTATSEILKVISSSPTAEKPVFDAIARSSVRLCDAIFGLVAVFDGQLLHLVSHEHVRTEGVRALAAAYPMPPNRGHLAGRAILDRAVIHVADVTLDAEYRGAPAIGNRATLSVPMLRNGTPIGTITIGRLEPVPFTDDQIALLKTFADQAVIAIENVRLFRELEARTAALTRSVEQLTALGEVGRAVSSTLDLETVLTSIVSRAVELSGLEGGVVFEYDDAAYEFVQRAQAGTGGSMAASRRATRIRNGEGVVGRTAMTLEPVQVSDITEPGAYVGPNRENLIESGVRAILAVPMVREGQLIGCLGVTRNQPGEFPAETIDLLRTFATQSALAIQNARLFHEVENKSRQLEVASRHKSEFLASMSHELRTPLNAILGFNEMILGDVYGEVPTDLRDPLTEMQNSGRHLLRLINNVLDLSKIEAGRMELALGDYVVQDTVAQVRASLHPLAEAKGLEFLTTVPADIPLAYGDAGRITQCLMNLAGNAIKFTRRGRVAIEVELQGERVVYRVSDTGIGIERDKIGTLFTEFRQGDAMIASEFGGTGLGLSITRKFAEMHGGRIWVESEPGKGSTFFLALPLRVDGGGAT